jgi:type IV secretory pathway TraG/TraD family ATPase VirD4
METENSKPVPASYKCIRDIYGEILTKRIIHPKKHKKRRAEKHKYHNEDFDNDEIPYVSHRDIPYMFGTQLSSLESSAHKGDSVPKWMELELQDGGFYFGRNDSSHYVGKPQDDEGNIITIGGPGSGKTAGIVKPTLEKWKGHIVVIDVKPKGDLRSHCEQLSTISGRRVMVFNPHNKDSFSIDPYDLLRSDGKKNLARNAKELALALITPQLEIGDTIWIKSAQNLLAGAIIYYFELGATFIETMTAIQLYTVTDLIDEINTSENTVAKMYISKLKGLKPETLAGIGMDLIDLAVLAADPAMELALCCNEESRVLSWNILNIDTDPCTMILQIPEENLDVWEPLTKLLLNQLIRTLQRRPDKYSQEGKNLPPVLIILDEFASLGRISSIKSGLTTLRSRGVTFALVIQSLNQLDEIYGAAARRTIFDACAYKAFLNVTDPDSQKYCSDLIGSFTTANKGVSTSHSPSNGRILGYSMNLNETRTPRIQPHEFASLKDIVLMTPDGYCRVEKAPYYEQFGDTFVMQEPLSSNSETIMYFENTNDSNMEERYEKY